VNAILAINVTTCTQGDAANLLGGFITLFFYLIGIAFLSVSQTRRIEFLALVPAIAIAAWHTWFAIRFAAGYLLEGMSACFAIEGGFTPDDAGEWMDGGERLYVALWLGLSLLFWVGVVTSFVRARSRE
jgi:CDP-diglyceride synthetase